MRLAAQNLLLQLVTMSGLIGGTIEYIEIVKRRVERRRREAEQRAAQEAGLRGLVRVLLTER